MAREIQTISIVVPVFRGEETLGDLSQEIFKYFTEPILIYVNGKEIEIALKEVILVHDGGSEESAQVIEDLARNNELIKPIWLSKNFGQHAATLAGIQISSTDWIVTLDEDGRHNPSNIGKMLNQAFSSKSTVVYGINNEPDSHNFFRKITSRALKAFVIKILLLNVPNYFSSFRLIHGEVGRSIAIYSGKGVYIDAALSWVTSRFTYCKVAFRKDNRKSTYTTKRLLEHFSRLIISTGVPPLRVVFFIGIAAIIFSSSMAGVIIYQVLANGYPIQGWASTMVVLLLFFGLIVFILGLIAEFTAAQLRMNMGQPLFVISSSPSSRIQSKIEVVSDEEQ